MLCFINPLYSLEFSMGDVKAEIEKHFAQPQGGIQFSTEIESNSALSDQGNTFFKENFLYIDYLSKHSDEYIEQTAYTFSRYLLSKGNNITGFMEDPREELSIHDLKATGVRFFYPVMVTKEGKIGTRICVTGEGFRDYIKRNLPIEAFCFHTIFNEIRKEDSYIMPRIQEFSKLASRLHLSDNEEDVLKRAQGVMWGLFYSDEVFEKILLDAYHDKETYLPFKVMLQ